jgi:hypothetical protein
MKCWGGTKARSISTSATTIFFASFLKVSNAFDATATTLTRQKKVYTPKRPNTVSTSRKRKNTCKTEKVIPHA